jgi:homogentisate 1,2-dioxygenase
MNLLNYLSGFGNEHSTEALKSALPSGQNSPQCCPYGLYAEQLSGSAFTAPRQHNLRSWLYRVRPSVVHRTDGILADQKSEYWKSAPTQGSPLLSLGPRRWRPLPLPSMTTQISFLEGIHTYTVAGSVDQSTGIATHLYVMNKAMEIEDSTHPLGMRQQYLLNADAELLIVPQYGSLHINTEFGQLHVDPTEMAVIPRGVIFQVNPLTLDQSAARGYICENYGAPFELPQLGPIGANCLAYPRDFLYPVASFATDDQLDHPCELYTRWGGHLYKAQIPYCPLDVVAWHGNYAPYKYDLKRFCTIGSISFDHPDPSIFTVLTSPSNTAGVANVDFVIFPDRWLVAEHSFRPPWYHRNIMSEFMGLITGVYDAKEEGFSPGGVSLHNLMIPHGPDAFGFDKASASTLEPQKLAGTLAFMFETRLPQHITDYAMNSPLLEKTYNQCWSGLKRHFNGELKPLSK